MNCCAECFLDIELKGFVNSNSNSFGKCDFCETENTALVNTPELQDQLTSLLDVYSVSEKGRGVEKALQDDWNIFKIKDSDKIKELIIAVVNGFDDYRPLLNSLIAISIPSETTELIENWESFKEEIKKENRFFIKNRADLESIGETLPVRKYSKGKIFFRSRISNGEKGYTKEKMGKPPYDLSKSGRANPKGISYLYVAQSMDTTFYEARATFLDYVTIADFKLLRDLNVITLRTTFQVSPFLEDFSIEKYLKNKTFIDMLESELSKPLRRNDNELDYIPTQYLCEYIKHLDFDGVEYGSSLDENGINIVFFNDSNLECISTKVYEVSKINIKSKEVIY